MKLLKYLAIILIVICLFGCKTKEVIPEQNNTEPETPEEEQPAKEPEQETQEPKEEEEPQVDEDFDENIQGTLEVYLSAVEGDISHFDEIKIKLKEIILSKRDSDYKFKADLIKDELEIRNILGNKAFLIEKDLLPATTYYQIEIYIDSITAKQDGKSVKIETPVNKLMLSRNINIKEKERTSFVFKVNVIKQGEGYYLIADNIESGTIGQEIPLGKIKVVSDAAMKGEEEPEQQEEETEETGPKEYTIELSYKKLSPTTLHIKVGDKVIWNNKRHDLTKMQQQALIIGTRDCKELVKSEIFHPGETYEVIFDEKMECTYTDPIYNLAAKIYVE